MEFELNYWFFGTDSNDRKQIEDVEHERGAELSFSGPRSVPPLCIIVKFWFQTTKFWFQTDAISI